MTKSYSIIDFISQIFANVKRFEMMGIQYPTSIFTNTTSEIISFKNFFAPKNKFLTISSFHLFRSYASLPIPVLFSTTLFCFFCFLTTTRLNKSLL